MPGSSYFGENPPGIEFTEPATDATVSPVVVARTAVVPAVSITATGGTTDVTATPSVVVATGVVPAVFIITFTPGAGGDGGSHHGRRRRHSGS